MTQTVGEFEEKARRRRAGFNYQQTRMSLSISWRNGRHVWRVIDNLMNNICKVCTARGQESMSILKPRRSGCASKPFANISQNPLNSAGELMERLCAEINRATQRDTVWGFSIAPEPDEADWRRYGIIVDGDLFKVILAFNQYVPQFPRLWKKRHRLKNVVRTLTE